MIAFDDAGMARVMIAAGAVPRRQRGQWLERIAERIAGELESAARSRRHRRTHDANANIARAGTMAKSYCAF